MAWGSVLLGNTTIDALDRWPTGVSSANKKLRIDNFRIARRTGVAYLNVVGKLEHRIQDPR
jgi:hypothetical protein